MRNFKFKNQDVDPVNDEFEDLEDFNIPMSEQFPRNAWEDLIDDEPLTLTFNSNHE